MTRATSGVGDQFRFAAPAVRRRVLWSFEDVVSLCKAQHMSHIDLDQARTRLLAELEHLDRQFNDIDAERRADGPIDKLTGDAGQDTARVDTELRQEAEIQTARTDVLAALQRIDDGTYGIDEETGEPINPERLDALPTARGNIR